MRRALEQAWSEVGRLIDVERVIELLEAGKLDALLAVADVTLNPDDFTAVSDLLLRALTGTGGPTAVEFGMSFTSINPEAVRWATRHSAQLVTGIDDATRSAIRDLTVKSILEGIPPEAQAKQIVRMVGLLPQHAGAVQRFLSGQLARGISEDRAAAQADRMARRLRKYRARMIARTETMRAANMGQVLAWRNAADAGFIDPAISRKRWIVTRDDRLCPICAPLDGASVGFSEDFRITEQATGFDIERRGIPGEGGVIADPVRVTGTRPLNQHIVTESPPAHPQCRCAVGLEFVAGEQRAEPIPFDRTTSHAEAQAWADSLSADEQKVLQQWINNPTRLRAADAAGKSTKALDDFYGALQRAPEWKDTMHRGMRMSRSKAEKMLQQIIDTGGLELEAASSFSWSAQASREFGTDIVLHVEGLTGRNIGPISVGGQKEIIAGSGSRYRYLRHQTKTRTIPRPEILGGPEKVQEIHVFMEEIPPLIE